jgi:hypothetical protein
MNFNCCVGNIRSGKAALQKHNPSSAALAEFS